MERFTFQASIHGIGGFAKVIRGKDNELDRDIAVKVLDQLIAGFSDSDRERFRREGSYSFQIVSPEYPFNLRRAVIKRAFPNYLPIHRGDKLYGRS